MKRSTQLTLGISLTVGITLWLAWWAVQWLVVQPSLRAAEPARVQQVREAAELLRAGVGKREVEVSRAIDIRLFRGPPTGPPEGADWVPLPTPEGTLWKRDGGSWEIAAWTGQTWVALQAHQGHRGALALALLVSGLPVVVLMSGLGQRVWRHQARAEESLARIAAGDLSERLDTESGTREVRRVARAVNQMAERLQGLLEADRQRMAGLSHELRTPLTRIRLELELARREGASVSRLDRVEREIEDFDAMLREMLDLSRLQLVGAQTMEPVEVDLAGLARWVLQEEELEGVEIQGAGLATVDRTLVARLLRNLLRNSVQHAGAVRRWVEVEDGLLRVGDEGPGIAPARQAHILEAFQRGDRSTGHGLGLAIVAQIAALHGGRVELSAPPGLVVSVTFGPRPAR